MIEELFLVHFDIGLEKNTAHVRPFLKNGPVNITGDQLEVDVSNPNGEKVTCELFTWQGEKVKSRIKAINRTFCNFLLEDISSLSKGLYYIQLSTPNDEILSQRPIILWDRDMM